LMLTMELDQLDDSGAKGFCRVPMPREMTVLIEDEIADLDNMRFESAAGLFTERFTGGADIPDALSDAAQHLHVRWGPMTDSEQFLNYCTQMFDWAERGDRRFSRGEWR
jgi:hypothetical protein